MADSKNSQSQQPNEHEHKYEHFLRAKVVETDIDGNDYGAIRVFIPDLMYSEIDEDIKEDSTGLIAYPANNPAGGYNEDDKDKESFYQTSAYVPPKGAWVWLFFEGGNPSRPFYFSAFHGKQSKLPPENRNVDKPHKVYTVIKTNSGRSIISSDSTDVERIEITGKRRKLSGSDPAGNSESSYKIDENMTTILLDERDGKEKVLIRTHKGDYLHIDIDEQELQCYFKNDITFKTDGNLNINVAKEIKINSGAKISVKTKGDIHSECLNMYQTQKMTWNVRSTLTNFIDGLTTLIQCGMAMIAMPSSPKSPEGDRDT